MSNGLFKRGNTYHFDFHLDGRRYQGTTHLKNERLATKYVDALRTRIALGEVGLESPISIPTFREFRKQFEELVHNEVKSPKSKRFYLDCYDQMLKYPKWADDPLNQIDEPKINAFRVWALAHVSKTRIDRYMATLKRALRHAHRDLKLIKQVPVIKMYGEQNTREHVYSTQEYSAWLNAAPEPLRSCSVLAHDRGVCRNEMLALQKDCVRFLEKADERGSWGTIVIKRGLKRDARARTLTLTKSMRDVLMTNMAKSKCRFVFTDREDPSEPLSEFVLGSQIRELKKALGSHADCGLHGLRHTFLTRAGEHVRNVRTLQLIAGHANIQTTMRYVHPSRDDIADALSSCDGTLQTPNETQKARADENGSCCPTCGRGLEKGMQVVTTNFTTVGSPADV